ncbi:MAG: Fe2+-dependent dioxygenase [Alphaproteobacteria bacterium]
MITLIPSVLDPATIDAARAALGGLPNGRDMPCLQARIVARLLANRAFLRAALPKRIVRLEFNRYEPGMGCGPHVDEPIIAGCRTDLSFTLFLTDPTDYERGDLIVETGAGWEMRKHAAGDLVLYPSRYVHSVAPVTRGTRLAATGWIESLTPSAERREILGDLDAALALIDASGCILDARLRVQNARANLVRLWISGGE